MGIENIDVLKQSKQDPVFYDEALASWHQALENRENQRANVVLIGPSTIEGYPVTGFELTTAQRLARDLRAEFPTRGRGSKGGRGRLGVPTPGIAPAIPSPLSFVGGAFDPPNYDVVPTFHFGANHVCWYTNFPGDKFSFKMGVDETSFDLIHKVGESGHATAGWYTVNGGAQVVFSTASGVHAGRVLRVSVPGGAEVEIGCSGTGELILSEIITYAEDESSGIMVHGVGRSGYTCAQWAEAPTYPGGWRTAILNLAPDVIVIEAGVNDAALMSSEQFMMDLDLFITYLRGASLDMVNVPILITAPYNVESAMTFLEPWENYVERMRTMAANDPLVAFYNYGDDMPPTDAPETFGFYHDDNIHGSSDGKGYGFMADRLFEVLARS